MDEPAATAHYLATQPTAYIEAASLLTQANQEMNDLEQAIQDNPSLLTQHPLQDSPELPEMGDDEGKEKLNNSSLIEDGEIFDTPLRNNKMGRKRFGRWDDSDVDLRENENNGEQKRSKMILEESDDDEIQVICEIPKGQGQTKMLTMGNSTSMESVTGTDELSIAKKRIEDLERETELRKGFLVELNESKGKIKQLEGLLDDAIKKTRSAEARAEAAENSIAASKPVNASSKWLNEELQAKIKDQSAEINKLKGEVCQLKTSLMVSKSDPMSTRMIEELEEQNKKLIREKEIEMKQKEEADQRMKDMEKKLADCEKKLVDSEKQLVDISKNVFASFESPGMTPEKELIVMRANMEIMKKELVVTREINTKVATIALGSAIKELNILKEKNLELEDKVRSQPFAGTPKEVEDLKKKIKLLLHDNVKFKLAKKNADDKDAETKKKNEEILQQRDKLLKENKELLTKLVKLQTSAKWNEKNGTNGTGFINSFTPIGVPPPQPFFSSLPTPSTITNFAPPPSTVSNFPPPPSTVSNFPPPPSFPPPSSFTPHAYNQSYPFPHPLHSISPSTERPSVPPRFPAPSQQSFNRGNYY